jgi:dihydroxyacetone kinase
MGSLNQPGFSLTLLNLTHAAKSASSVEQIISLIDAPHATAAWPTNSIIGSTPEALRKRTREERSIDIPKETAEVVVGGPKLYGTFRGAPL